jgi:hypothetical protein
MWGGCAVYTAKLLSRLIIVNLFGEVKQFSFGAGQALDYATTPLVLIEVRTAATGDVIGHVVHLLTQ